VSGDGRTDRESGPFANTAFLRLATGPLVGPVLCRVVSMVLARANCPMDRLDDAMLICDALSAHAPEHASDGSLSFALSAEDGSFELRLGELAEHAGEKVVRDSVLPGVGNVLERMTDELLVVSATDGHHEELVLKLRF
jgi:hypothetical protein